MSITRRDFLKGAAAGTAMLFAAPMLNSKANADDAKELKADREESADIVIVGGGAAGLMAALTAQECGKKCIILEKGASLAVANGANAGGPILVETPTGKELNEWVTKKQTFDYLYSFAHGTVDAKLLSKCLDESMTVWNHYADHGLHWGLQPDKWGAGFRPRHMICGDDGNQVKGAGRVEPLQKYFEEIGGRVYCKNEGKQLVLSGEKVTGIIAYDSETKENVLYNAKAVLISTGGYLGSKEMLREHFGDINIIALGSTLSCGDGINMVKAAGGFLDRKWGLCCNELCGANEKTGAKGVAMTRASDNLSYALYGGLLVDPKGERFVNEQDLSDAGGSCGGEATIRAGKFYAIVDEEYMKACNESGIVSYYDNEKDWYVGRVSRNRKLENSFEQLEKDVEAGWAFKADTVEELAEHFGLAKLSETVANYNAMAESGEDTQFSKSAYLMKALKTAPYYAFEYEPSAWCTFGGVYVDDSCRVVREDMKPLPGLYAAGLDAGSLYTAPYYSLGGTGFGLALLSGVVAARTMVEDSTD